MVRDAKRRHNFMKTEFYYASAKEVKERIEDFPSYRTATLQDIAENREELCHTNPSVINTDVDFLEEMYELASFPNSILGGYTYRNMYNFLKKENNLEELKAYYKSEEFKRTKKKFEIYRYFKELFFGKVFPRPIWIIESFDGPKFVLKRKGSFLLLFLNEKIME